MVIDEHPISTSFEDRLSAAIKASPHLGIQHDVQCLVHDGRVTLKGVVGTYFQKQIAQEVIRRIDGVEDIANELEVSWFDSHNTFTSTIS